MAGWDVTLRGGPFHGDRARIEKLPPRIYVSPCPATPSCGTHWFDKPDGEPYTLDEVFTDERATYVHGDTTGDSAPSAKERKKEPVPA